MLVLVISDNINSPNPLIKEIYTNCNEKVSLITILNTHLPKTHSFPHS